METKQKKQIIIGAVALVAVIAIALVAYNKFSPKATKGGKNIVVEVVNRAGESTEFEYSTDDEFLGDLLLQEKLIEGEQGEFGLFVKTVNGETADDSKQEWWCITKNKEQVNTAIDKTPIEDGAHYEITLTVGY